MAVPVKCASMLGASGIGPRKGLQDLKLLITRNISPVNVGWNNEKQQRQTTPCGLELDREISQHLLVLNSEALRSLPHINQRNCHQGWRGQSQQTAVGLLSPGDPSDRQGRAS